MTLKVRILHFCGSLVFDRKCSKKNFNGIFVISFKFLSNSVDMVENLLRAVGVSAMTGEGLDEFLDKLDEATEEYESDYKVEYERLKTAKVKAEKEANEERENPKKKTVNLIESSPMESDSNIYLRYHSYIT